MAIDFNSGPNALFPRLGRIGRWLYGLHGAQAVDTLPTVNDELGRYPPVDQHLSSQLAANRDAFVRGVPSNGLQLGQGLASPTLRYMVAADQPTRAADDFTALSELIRQMQLGGVTVKAATVGVTTAPFAGVTGTQVLLVSTQRGDGRFQELLVAEAAQVRCTADARTGGAQVGGEQYTFYGVPAGSATAADYDWPLGSAAGTSFSSAWALTNNAGGPGQNRLVNGGFDGVWVAGAPSGWLVTGAITQELAILYATGTAAVRVAAGGTPTLSQAFDNPTQGTTYKPLPNQSLGFCLFVRSVGGVPGAGVVRVELWSGAGVVNDSTGAPARADFALAAAAPLADTWYPLAGVVRTPAILPAGLALRVNVQTGAGAALLLDHGSAAPLVAAYNGGPGVLVFAGAVPALLGDGFTVTTTNDRGGSLYGSTFQVLFDRLYGMRNHNAPTGLLLPTAGVPTIPDTLITV